MERSITFKSKPKSSGIVNMLKDFKAEHANFPTNKANLDRMLWRMRREGKLPYILDVNDELPDHISVKNLGFMVEITIKIID